VDGTVKVTSQTTLWGILHKQTLNRTLKREKTGVREVVTISFEPKYEVKEHNLELTSKFSTANDFSVGTTVKDLIGNGSKVELSVSKSEKDGFNGIALASYKSEPFALKGKVTYPLVPKRPIKLNTEAVVHLAGYNSNVGVGVDVSLEGEIARINTEGVLSHNTKDSQFKATARYDVYNSSLLWGFSFFQKVSEHNNWTFDLTSEENSSKNTFTVGSDYKVNDHTSVKGKWKLVKEKDKVDYRFGASIKQKLSPCVTATLGSDLNPRSFIGSNEGDPHTFGLEIKLQD